MVRVAPSSDEAARVWHAGFGRESERRKQATSICRSAQLLHSGPLPQRRGGGAVSWQNQEQLPRLQGLTGAIAAEQLPFINSGPSRDSSRSLLWCQSPLQRITCSNHRDGLLHACGTDSSIDFPGAAPQRKAHDPSCAMLLVSIISAAAGR